MNPYPAILASRNFDITEECPKLSFSAIPSATIDYKDNVTALFSGIVLELIESQSSENLHL
jgi:hypothetical protein